MNDVYYFGCWNVSGHYLFGSRGGFVPYALADQLVYYEASTERRHLDGTLAPRKVASTGAITWDAQAPKGQWTARYTSELPQGQFLRHELSTGFTAIQWWDRTQGDQRGGCNGTVLLRGKRTSEEMLAALAEHFPSVLANLTKAGVVLVEVYP